MAQEKKGLAIASLVLGLFFWMGLIGMVCSILAIIFGAIQLKNIKKSPKQYSGRGMAIAGIVLGIVGILLILVTSILAYIFVMRTI